MTNNEERYCKVCGRETLFFLDSDLLWYCDECGSVFGANPKINQEDMDDYFLEDNDEETLICKTCYNIILIEDVLEEGLCPICFNDLDMELSEKGYILGDDGYYKEE